MVAKEYNSNFNEINQYVCSSINTESPIEFVKNNNKISTVLSLKFFNLNS